MIIDCFQGFRPPLYIIIANNNTFAYFFHVLVIDILVGISYFLPLYVRAFLLIFASQFFILITIDFFNAYYTLADITPKPFASILFFASACIALIHILPVTRLFSLRQDIAAAASRRARCWACVAGILEKSMFPTRHTRRAAFHFALPERAAFLPPMPCR